MKMMEDAKAIFSAALKRVDPSLMIRELVALEGGRLTIRTETESYSFDLDSYDEVLVIGAGKASAKMALGLEAVLGDRISSGLVAVKEGHTEELARIELIEAGHPMPDRRSVEAGTRIAGICAAAGAKSLILNLISGGGSAILTAPYGDDAHTVTLEELQQVTGLLLACGAPIQEINVIRKHLSAVKGGRLAGLAAPATMVSLILSDVIGDPLDAIASGPTVPDPTTWADAAEIIRAYGLQEKLPASVAALLAEGTAGKISDTPDETSGIFESVSNILIGTNISALQAAAEEAGELGYGPVILTSQLTGEAREIAKLFSGIAKDLCLGRLAFPRPACIITGGETTVTLKGKGKGGRNQEMAVAFLREFLESPGALTGVVFLSGGTDGNDGPTDAAGGIAHSGVLGTAVRKKLSPGEYIEKSDSYHFLKECDGLLMTGPTNTNVCDVQILLVDQAG
jgi:glycerate 2-kinase